MALVALIAGCSDDEERPGRGLPQSATGTGATSGTSMGAGGDGGSGTGGGATGGGATTGSGGAGGMVLPEGEPTCTGNVAFRASGMSFVAQTPQDLAGALNGLTYDPLTHPMTILLLAAKGPAEALVAAAASETGAMGEAFPDAQTPTPVAALLAPGSFSNPGPQATSWLRVVDDTGPVDLQLNTMTLNAQTYSKCMAAFVSLDAYLPESEGSKSLTIDGSTTTIAQLAGPASVDGWPIRALFLAATTTFDLGSFP